MIMGGGIFVIIMLLTIFGKALNKIEEFIISNRIIALIFSVCIVGFEIWRIFKKGREISKFEIMVLIFFLMITVWLIFELILVKPI